jgi:hypothetical protein
MMNRSKTKNASKKTSLATAGNPTIEEMIADARAALQEVDPSDRNAATISHVLAVPEALATDIWSELVERGEFQSDADPTAGETEQSLTNESLTEAADAAAEVAGGAIVDVGNGGDQDDEPADDEPPGLLVPPPDEQQQSRAGILEEMNPRLRKVAHTIEKAYRHETVNQLLTAHDIGAEVDRVRVDDATYGSAAVEKLAEFFDVSPSHLYNLGALARNFSRKDIKKLATMQMASGDHLTLHHLLAIVHFVPTGGPVIGLVQRVLDDSLSVRQLQELLATEFTSQQGRVTTAGRKPAKPPNPAIGARRITKKLESFCRFADVAGVSIAEVWVMPPDQIDAPLVENLKAAQAAITRTNKMLAKLAKGLQHGIGRALEVQKVAAKRKALPDPSGRSCH